MTPYHWNIFLTFIWLLNISCSSTLWSCTLWPCPLWPCTLWPRCPFWPTNLGDKEILKFGNLWPYSYSMTLFVPYDPVPYDQGDLFGLLICLYQVNRIKYGLTIYMHLWTNQDSEKVSPNTIVKASLKSPVSLMTPSKTFCKTAILYPMSHRLWPCTLWPPTTV